MLPGKPGQAFPTHWLLAGDPNSSLGTLAAGVSSRWLQHDRSVNGTWPSVNGNQTS